MATESTHPKQSARPDKDEPKVEVKESKAEAKAEAKPEAKAEAKPEAKAEAKADPKQEAKAADGPSLVGRAESIIRRNVLWSIGAGAVPLPGLDAVAVTGVQVKMLAELSHLYSVKFTEDIAKKLVGALLGGVGGVTLGAALGGSLAKLVPGVGTALGLVTMPIVAGAFTHAVGKVFLMHFESGGTLLDFDPYAMRAHFKQEFEKAKETVAQMHKNERAKADAVP
ncbi:YcjF family protein [Polyangium sorediatum]|uniref:DUF697 domain-containing protein n=1 Tax=Polyangium sorediatum TaxID=889274 RepID=A0ABT6NYF2_9BACT|nr:DUF697 domain-containing protein [Polyangium sorediatum]MDI1433376.1 DUF697 domain-containing protein [Polyangium sorediatum]